MLVVVTYLVGLLLFICVFLLFEEKCFVCLSCLNRSRNGTDQGVLTSCCARTCAWRACCCRRGTRLTLGCLRGHRFTHQQGIKVAYAASVADFADGFKHRGPGTRVGCSAYGQICSLCHNPSSQYEYTTRKNEVIHSSSPAWDSLL